MLCSRMLATEIIVVQAEVANLVQQAPNPVRGMSLNHSPQLLQHELIFLRFFREFFHLSVVPSNVSIQPVTSMQNKRNMYQRR